MIGKVVIFVCIATLFIAIEGKPMRKDVKSQHKNGGRSILKLAFSQAAINRGVSININGRRIAKKAMENIHEVRHRELSQNDVNFTPKESRQREQSRRLVKLTKSPSKYNRTLAATKNTKDLFNMALKLKEKRVNLRSKRSVSKKLTGRNEEHQADSLQELIEAHYNEENAANDDFKSEEEQMNVRRPSRKSQKPALEYAYDTTDNDYFNENDEFLRKHRETDGTYMETVNSFRSPTDSDDRAIQPNNHGMGLNSITLPNDYLEGNESENEYDNEAIYDDYANYYDNDY